MDDELKELILKLDKFTDAVYALVGVIAMQYEDQDDTESETYLDGTARE